MEYEKNILFNDLKKTIERQNIRINKLQKNLSSTKMDVQFYKTKFEFEKNKDLSKENIFEKEQLDVIFKLIKKIQENQPIFNVEALKKLDVLIKLQQAIAKNGG